MQFKQYLKITLPDGSFFCPSPDGFPQLECRGPFSHLIWEEGTTDFWFVDEKGIATYAPNFWVTPSNCSSWISSGNWIAEPMNPRFVHSDPNREEEWTGYLELIDEQIWMIYYDPDRTPLLCYSIEMADLKRHVERGVWKQIPPIQTTPSIKPEPIPAKKPELEDIFHTL